MFFGDKMLEPPFPPDEKNRMIALHGLHILDTPPEERFDRLTRIAKCIIDVPIALVSLVDSNRQWFKSSLGLDVKEISRCISFCGHAIHKDEIFIIPDASKDSRFADNPLVTGAPHIRFYAGKPLKAKDGSSLGTLCVIDIKPRNITQIEQDALCDIALLVEKELNSIEFHEAIKEMESSKKRLEAIFDNVLDGIITINEVGIIESFNKSAENIFQYNAMEVINNNVSMLMPEPYQSYHDKYMNSFIASGKKKIIGIGREVVGLRKDGSTFPMDLAVTEMQLGDKRLFTGIMRDITERVKVERMKNEFISTVSHELRTPLTSISGSLALLVGGAIGELPDTFKQLIEIAYKNCERLILLVNDILDMEKINAGKMEMQMQPLKLIPLLEQAIEGNRAYGEQFKVSYLLANASPDVMIMVDMNRMLQVLANLLSNAAKFSPIGGKVWISVKQIGMHIRVEVNDNGSGIPEQFKTRIFQKFAQADSSDTRKKGGTGLGLSITKSIIENMGGSLGFDSQPNVLTTFFFEFPVWEDGVFLYQKIQGKS
jgi:PAS domain S-box-containing protein